MTKENLSHITTISKDYRKKVLLKIFLILIAIISSNLTWILLMLYGIDITDSNISINIEIYIWVIILVSIVPSSIVLSISSVFFSAYIRRFSYNITEDKLIINHGVLTRTRATIPYSRIQNINIVNGIFDRIFKTFTVKIETAGSSGIAAGQAGNIRPEGYIPGVKNPLEIEKKINEMLKKYSQIPSGLEDKIFKPEELAFDNFISYILSKMREGENLKTKIKELMEKEGLTKAKLAEKVGVPLETIIYLIEGRYNPSLSLAYKIAKVLNCKIEDLFILT